MGFHHGSKSDSHIEMKLIRHMVVKADTFIKLGARNRTLGDNRRSFGPDPNACIQFIYSLPAVLEHLGIGKNTIAKPGYFEYVYFYRLALYPHTFPSSRASSLENRQYCSQTFE